MKAWRDSENRWGHNLASIDVGTNTIRLWIGKIKDQKFLTIHTDRANVRLGEGLKQQGVAVVRAAPILERLKMGMERRSFDDFRAIGTSVFRKSGNGEETIQRLYNQKGGYRLVGIAGTATTLAAMDLVLRNYISELVHGHVLTINKLLALFDWLRVKKAKDRLARTVLEPGREDISLAGLIVWIGLLKAFSLPEMTVSHNGILEGIAIDIWERNREICYTK
jgi:exopolyphosphatase/pppGpp-phosphohydrolase